MGMVSVENLGDGKRFLTMVNEQDDTDGYIIDPV